MRNAQEHFKREQNVTAVFEKGGRVKAIFIHKNAQQVLQL